LKQPLLKRKVNGATQLNGKKQVTGKKIGNLKTNKKMSDLKLYIMNGSTIGVTTLAPMEDWLKIILLVVTIGYTIAKWSKVKEDE
jgi:hypothetical protein